MFPTFDYTKVFDKENYSYNVTQRIYEAFNPSGSLKEIGYDYDRKRRGLGHTWLYAIGILIENGTYSDLAMAEKMFEYINSKMFPYGGHEFPIDNWGNDDTFTASAGIECQVVSEILFTL